MKKYLSAALIAVLVLILCATGAFAVFGGHGIGHVGHRQASCRYLDADGNGVCDNCGAAAGSCTGYVDADGDGVCDYRGANGSGRGFVDADGDGICDNCTGSGIPLRDGTGRRAGGRGCMVS